MIPPSQDQDPSLANYLERCAVTGTIDCAEAEGCGRECAVRVITYAEREFDGG